MSLPNAITCFHAALRVYTERDYPVAWATTQNNLGVVYGERAETVANAVACFYAALRVRTERDFPVAWATTQTNLGVVYFNLPTGNHVENVSNAITCWLAALRVYTECDFPARHASIQDNLGIAYQELTVGDSGYRQQAIACFEAAARGYSAVGLIEDADKERQRAEALRNPPSD